MRTDRESGKEAAQFREAVALLKANRKRGRVLAGATNDKGRLAKAAKLIEAELKQRGQLK